MSSLINEVKYILRRLSHTKTIKNEQIAKTQNPTEAKSEEIKLPIRHNNTKRYKRADSGSVIEGFLI